MNRPEQRIDCINGVYHWRRGYGTVDESQFELLKSAGQQLKADRHRKMSRNVLNTSDLNLALLPTEEII